MAQYSPKKIIRSISKALLQRYFAGRKLLGDFKWSECREDDPDAVIEAMEELDAKVKEAVDADFATVNELATDGGSRLIYEEASYWKKPWVKKLDGMANDIERALLALIEDRQLVETVLAFNEMDRFGESRWQRWNVGKRLRVNDDDQHQDRLRKALREIFKNEGRGKHCHLDPVERRDPDRYCLFAYPEDYPKTDLGYDNKGKFARHIRRTATEIIFAYRREEGVLEMIASGDQKRREKIAGAFCKEILGLTVLPDPRANPPFSLDVLKRGDFAFKTAPADNVERVELRLLRFDLPWKGYRRLVLSGRPTPDMPNVLWGMIDEAINTTKVPLSELHVSQARLSFRFRGQNSKRGKTLTFEVTYPDRCNLKDHGLDVVAKKYLVEWKIASA